MFKISNLMRFASICRFDINFFDSIWNLLQLTTHRDRDKIRVKLVKTLRMDRVDREFSMAHLYHQHNHPIASQRSTSEVTVILCFSSLSSLLSQNRNQPSFSEMVQLQRREMALCTLIEILRYSNGFLPSSNRVIGTPTKEQRKLLDDEFDYWHIPTTKNVLKAIFN